MKGQEFDLSNIFRDDIGRELFLQKVWQWKEAKGNHIFDQLKRLGASCDWESTTFTMSAVGH